MTIQTRWDNDDKTIVRMEFEPDWLLNDLHAAVEQADTLISSVRHQVDIIIDIQKGMKIPKDFMSIATEILENPNPRPNEGQRVVVGANKTIRFLYNTVHRAFSSKLGDRKLLFERDLETARSLLIEMRVNGTSPEQF